MRIICVDSSLWARRRLIRAVRRIAPDSVIHACRDPTQAAALAKAKGCDVLLTEIEMDGRKGEGLILARRLRADDPRLNVIFVTACPEREYARDVVQMRASGYVNKPWGQKALAEEFAHLRYARQGGSA